MPLIENVKTRAVVLLIIMILTVVVAVSLLATYKFTTSNLLWASLSITILFFIILAPSSAHIYPPNRPMKDFGNALYIIYFLFPIMFIFFNILHICLFSVSIYYDRQKNYTKTKLLSYINALVAAFRFVSLILAMLYIFYTSKITLASASFQTFLRLFASFIIVVLTLVCAISTSNNSVST